MIISNHKTMCWAANRVPGTCIARPWHALFVDKHGLKPCMNANFVQNKFYFQYKATKEIRSSQLLTIKCLVAITN